MRKQPAPRPPRGHLRDVSGLVLGMLVVTACVAAVLGTAVVGAGLGDKRASDAFLAMPAAITPPAVPQRTVILDARGKPIAWLWKENRQVVELVDISPVMR